MKFYKQIVLILAFLTFSYADVPKGTSKSAELSQNKMVESTFRFETRDIVADIANNGFIVDYHISEDTALKFKEIGSVFQSSVWVGGIVNGSQRIILGDYTQDMGPGPYGSDPLSDENKIYYVELDMMASPEQYDDFQNWPTDQGAPYVDADGDGVYTPLPSGTDYPTFIGDKVAFFTTNDGDPAYKLNMGTSPLNLEFHFLIYSFDQPVDINLANSLFYKVKVINKGGDIIEGTYFGVWQDDDLGTAGDDLVGVDVARSLSYTYNDGVDSQMPNEQFVKGSDFLQGPMVDCISDGAVNITLLGSDEDGDQLEYVIATEPSNGTLTCNAESCTYYPDVNFIGKDTFTYYVQEYGNSANKSDEATVTINVVESGSMNGQNVRIDETAPVVSTKFGGTLSSPNHKALIKAMENIDLHSHQHDDGYVRCLTDELEQQLQIVDPGFIAQRDNFYDIVEKNKDSLDESKISTVNIPVIFHVLYFDEDDNISNAQITENFNQINDDFRLENADADKIPKTANRAEASDDPGIDYNHFYSRGSHDVRFVGFDGETKGTSLNEVTTIRRYKINQETVSGVSEASTLASSIAPDDGATGGYQAGYLNIYIAPLSGGLLGQAYLGFPEAVVMGSTVGSLTSPGTAGGYNRGRTLTHEIGHNFSFNHIFNSSNCDDVLWSDIPPQITNNRTAQVYEDTSSTKMQYAGRYAENSCIGSSGKGDQFMNYMDYVYDDQMRMFSDEQSNDGYSWAYSYDWYATGNSLPVAYDITMTASVDDDCAGAKMFGSYHPNKKNLPASSFAFFLNGDATYTDPSDESEGYNYLQGLRKDGSAYPNEIAGDLYDQKFAFYGDPNNPHGTNNPVDGNYVTSSDRRSLMSVGPFTMAPGDSQEIVFNILHAEGGSSLEALANLLTASDSIQTYYNNDFSILAVERAISISAAQTTGTVPHTTTFNLNSTFSFPIFEWDFNGDGITDSSSLNPTYTYNDPGEYTVTATAKYRYYEDGMFKMKPVTDSLSVTILDNSAITITADSLVTNEDTSLSSTLTISNPSNRSYALQLGLTPSNGIVSFNNATMNYTPNKNFNGLDSLKVFAKDGAYESSEALIKINVLPVDDTPVTADVAVSTNEDTAVTVYLTASEYDGDTYEFEIKEHPAYGSLSSILSSAGVDSVIYTPDTDWFGTDQFKFEASDSSSRMNLGTAVIQVLPVNDAPITEDVKIDTYEDVTTPITLSFSDVDNDEISITLTAPTNGSVELNGSYAEYVPNSNYYGTDSFNYYVSDGTEQSNVSNVSVNIEAVNDASSDFSIGDTYIVDSTAGEEWVVTTNSLIATKENEEDSLQFNWNESFDIDGDKIQYRMIGYNDLEFLTMDDWITDLTLSWSIKDLVANTDTVNVANGSWMIVASDGEFFVESNFGNPMELLINGSALIPDQYSLNQNYPNPFKNFTTISFDMPENQKIKIRIFDVRGRIIRTLINEDQSAGFKSILWDGKNEDGDEVSAGIYFYQMYAPSSANFKGITKTKRMVKFD